MNVITDNREHYLRVMQLLDHNPLSVKAMAYSIGNPQFHHEVDGQPSSSLNMLGLTFSMLNSKLKSRRIAQARLITNNPSFHLEVSSLFDQLAFRQHSELHAKAWIFQMSKDGRKAFKTDRIALVGSRNMSTTHWAEITVEVRGHNVQKIEDMFDACWKQAIDLSKQQNWFQQAQDLGEEFGKPGTTDGEDIDY